MPGFLDNKCKCITYEKGVKCIRTILNIKPELLGEIMREFIDKKREVANEYYDIIDRDDGSDSPEFITQMQKLIDIDPDFFDPYLILYKVYLNTNNLNKADKILDTAFDRAKTIILDNDKLPDLLEWGWLENRHILRTLFNKAERLWETGSKHKAEALFRNLITMSPNDNLGAGFYLLGLLMKQKYGDLCDRYFYNEDGGEMYKWYDKNAKNFPDEFKDFLDE